MMSARGHPDGGIFTVLTPEEWALAAATTIYSKAFVETLAKRHAEGLADMLRARFHKNGKTIEFHIRVADDASAVVVVTGDLPDEARLALLDLDVTDDAVRGKLLRWDCDSSAWRPTDDN